MGATPRVEGRNQGQESPYVGERTRHLDRSSTIKHHLDDDGDHELQVRDGEGRTHIDGLSMARDSKVVLEYRSVMELVQLYKTDVFTAMFGTKFDIGILS